MLKVVIFHFLVDDLKYWFRFIFTTVNSKLKKDITYSIKSQAFIVQCFDIYMGKFDILIVAD